jgi:hypothetical protein
MDWRETTQHERNLTIFQNELDEFLPERLVDFHIHIFPPGTTGDDMFCCAGHDLPAYTLDDLARDMAELYPGRETAGVVFGLPYPGYDRALNNRYIAGGCDGRTSYGLRLLDPLEDTAEGLASDLRSGAFLGVKPYLDYVRKENPNEVEVPEMLPDWAMEVVNDLGLAVMLHIPRKGRLADPLNKRQVRELCRRFPQARIVLAHIGRAYYPANIIGHIEDYLGHDNLYADLAMLNNWEVLEYAFAQFPEDKLLYGTDLPIAVAPGKAVEINDQYTYVTPVPWKLAISDEHGRLTFTSFVYEELRAVKKACQRLGKPRSFVERLFHRNADNLIAEITA